MGNTVMVAPGYPHELLGHIRRMEGTDNLRFLADTAKLVERYKEYYPDHTHGIKELEVAAELGIISEMISVLSEPLWRKRSFINKSAIRMMNNKGLKEFEMVELLESFMQLFGWDMEMELSRRWKVGENESAEWYKENHSREVHRSGSHAHSHKEEDLDVADYNAEFVEKINDLIDEEDYPEEPLTLKPAGSPHPDRTALKGRGERTSSGERSAASAGNRRKRPTSGKRVSDYHDNNRRVPGRRMMSDDPEPRFGGGLGDANTNHYYIDEHDYKRIESLFEIMSPREFIQNEILKSGLKFEQLMTNSIRRDAKKAINGNAEAQCRMGAYYAEPDTKHTDIVEAVKWYQVAASQGNDKAQFELGMLYDGGQIKCEDYKKKAMKCYLSLAESGFPSAQCKVGLKYRFGDGVEENLQEAVKWLKKSAFQGHVDAMRNLGDIYAGVGKPKEAENWYRKAAELGDVYSEKRIR